MRPGAHIEHYNIHRLVYFEYFQYVSNAIAREKELKRWTRAQKIALIEKVNPTWEDLKPSVPGSFRRPLTVLRAADGHQVPFGDDKQEKQERDPLP